MSIGRIAKGLKTMGRSHAAVLAWALALTLLAGGAASAAAKGSGPPITVQQTEEGPVFATAAGMTLYTFRKDDTTPGKSNCTNVRATTGLSSVPEIMPLPAVDKRRTCIQKWFPLIAAADAAPGGDWSIITRDEGARQWAYQGHPLYASSKDRRPGDVNGLGHFQISAGWRLAASPLGFPAGMKLVRLKAGLALAMDDDRPLYVRRGVQHVCSGCADTLQPALAPALGKAPAGEWSIVDIVGARQYAFKGRPLYVAPPGVDKSEIGSEWIPAIWRPTAGVPPDFATHFTVKGEIYTTRSGMSVYMFSCDTSGMDNLNCDEPGDAAAYWTVLCGLDCLKRWHPYVASPGAKPQGDWSVIDFAVPIFTDPTGVTLLPSQAPQTVRIWAYRGEPLFTYFQDDTPGQTLGHDIMSPFGEGFHAIQTPEQDPDIDDSPS
jgi:predicted lipoprotein with Yx(FWY)xxD motif